MKISIILNNVSASDWYKLRQVKRLHKRNSTGYSGYTIHKWDIWSNALAANMRTLTMLFLNWLSRKWVATWAGSRLKSIRLLECCSASISRFSSFAWICQRKSNRAVHSTWRPCKRTARTNMRTSTTLKTWAGITDLRNWAMQYMQVNLLRLKLTLHEGRNT